MNRGRRQFIQQLLSLGLVTSAGLSLAACGQAIRPSKFKTGVVLDPLFYEHNMDDHPENAQRLHAIDQELERRGLWDKLTPITSRKATEEELLWVHSQGYIDEIASISEYGGGYYNPYLGDTYLTSASFEAAKMAAGSAIQLNLAVYDRQVDNGFGLLRPPGHHALESKAMGFCLFNSDVIAAKALQKYRGVERVAILDFDVHHGNGTQDLTIDDPSIMAFSIHQHPFWPMTGGAEWVGERERPKALILIVHFPQERGIKLI
ncbi:MAG: histone deacetylase [Pseudomonadota bacterium]|nr:histone deacetylase [Pseudomonadota bacterium]